MSRQISVIGHRGWRERHPDNSLPGLIAAAAVCDAVEVDVRRSADGKLVLAHDPFIGGQAVATTPWSVLAEVELGGGARPCLLDEALAALPGTPVLIEIKNAPGESGYEPDHRLGLEAAAMSRPSDVLISFNWPTIDSVRTTFPEALTGLNLGILGDLDDAIQHCGEVGHNYLMPDADLVLVRAEPLPGGIDVAVWSARQVETDERSLGELVSKGVWGIITDDPPNTIDLLRSLT
ncbi:MAG: glycerophosphodiester phosphodiesterase [Acidimicrobiia bacterium]